MYTFVHSCAQYGPSSDLIIFQLSEFYNLRSIDHFRDLPMDSQSTDKENLSRWWGEDRKNPRGEPLSLDRALARSRQEVHPKGFPILTSSTWLIIYLAYSLLKLHINMMFFVLRTNWHIFRVGKCRLTSPSDVITTCVRTHSRTSNGWKRRQEGFPAIVKSKDCPIWYAIFDLQIVQAAKQEVCTVMTLVPLITWYVKDKVTWLGKDKVSYHCQIHGLSSPIGKISRTLPLFLIMTIEALEILRSTAKCLWLHNEKQRQSAWCP